MNTKELASYCLSCPKPRCQSACPSGNLIRDWIACCKREDYQTASRILHDVNPFPELTSLLCDHKRQCQGNCVRAIKGEAVAIPQIEYELSKIGGRDLNKGKPNGETVALVGAGIANLSAAYFLLKAGFEVEFFEKENFIGGAIRTGIPDFRFDKSPLDKIYDDLARMGATFHFNASIDTNASLGDLQQRFDYVILGIGASKNNSVGFEARSGLVSGLDILREINIGEGKRKYSKYKSSLVWGGGNVALDCARSLIRLGGKVTIVYRRSLKEMPASEVEIQEAIKEGINVSFLTNVKDLIKNDKEEVTGVKLVKMELGEADSSGRASCHEIPGSEYLLNCDLLVSAIGQKVDFTKLAADLMLENGHHTSYKDVYATGDCFLGAKNIASCIADGRECAKEIILLSQSR